MRCMAKIDYPSTIEALEEVFGTQKALAESVGVTPRTIQRYKSGEINIFNTYYSNAREKLYRRARHYDVRRYVDERLVRGLIHYGYWTTESDDNAEIKVWQTGRNRDDVNINDLLDHFARIEQLSGVAEQFSKKNRFAEEVEEIDADEHPFNEELDTMYHGIWFKDNAYSYGIEYIVGNRISWVTPGPDIRHKVP